MLKSTIRKNGNHTLIYLTKTLNREEANQVHHDVVEAFMKYSRKYGLDVILKKESEISDNDMLD